jgi:peptide/nickel transport system permease protein
MAVGGTATVEGMGDFAARKPRGIVTSTAIRLFREKPLGMWGGAFVILVLSIIAATSSLWVPHAPSQTHAGFQAIGPDSEFWFGTDRLGRDVFSRVMEGTKVTLKIAALSALIGTVLAAVIGIVSGYLGGWVDTLSQRVVDIFMAFPALIMLLALVSVFDPSQTTTIGVLAFFFTFGSSRVIRGSVLSVKESQYVESAKAMGAGSLRVMGLHILPNVMAPTIVIFTMNIGVAILAEAALSFLGFGVPPPAPAWGQMLADGRQVVSTQPWLSVFPGVAITITVFAFNVLGDALRDILDPRLRHT